MPPINELFSDLLNVEVNTIVKHSMTAEKMPTLHFALLDIIAEFSAVLANAGIDLEPFFSPSRADCWERIQRHANHDTPLPPTYDEGRDHIDEACKAYEALSGKQAPSHRSLIASPDYNQAIFNCLPDLWPAFTPFYIGEVRPTPLSKPFAMTRVTNGWDSFERLRIAALLAQPHLDNQHQVLLSRIIGSCSRLKYIVQGMEQRRCRPVANDHRGGGWFRRRRPQRQNTSDWATIEDLIPKSRNALLGGKLRHRRIPRLLRADEFGVVRKIWEVGTELVLVQTSVQLDGDVVTRISETLLSPDMTETRQTILTAHQENVSTALSHWRSLVDVALKLVNDAIGSLRS
ncbi:MAG TPA: hypothetical protein ENK31_08485 [Nannocystis exedens]|nr:hypothetical protein [Nannocystis exedens]